MGGLTTRLRTDPARYMTRRRFAEFSGLSERAIEAYQTRHWTEDIHWFRIPGPRGIVMVDVLNVQAWLRSRTGKHAAVPADN